MRIIVIYGPTASGKSALALQMAAENSGVIINADSMQIYDALPVLTARPSQEDLTQAPHLLYGTLDPAERCSAARWRALAIAEIGRALDSGRIPIVVGGTGFYLKALLEGLSPIPEVPPEIREKATALQAECGNPGFHAELSKRDPAMAARLHPNDTQRLIRAWEVLEATGQSLAEWQALPAEGPPAEWQFEKHFVNPDRAALYERCDQRFETMLSRGALDEVAALGKAIDVGEVPEDAAITHALGFSALRACLRGECTLEDAAARAKQETRNYAKRQVSWLNNQI